MYERQNGRKKMDEKERRKEKKEKYEE